MNEDACRSRELPNDPDLLGVRRLTEKNVVDLVVVGKRCGRLCSAVLCGTVVCLDADDAHERGCEVLPILEVFEYGIDGCGKALHPLTQEEHGISADPRPVGLAANWRLVSKFAVGAELNHDVP